ncbi:hypothetical protein GQ600_24682 [Phytophthora cactorum]|nr:hypothetical protein GQ600_24682 [Phytophthora cactorum]
MGVLGITDNYNVVDNLESGCAPGKECDSIFTSRACFSLDTDSPIFRLLLRGPTLPRYGSICTRAFPDTFQWDHHSELRRPSSNMLTAFSKSLKGLLLSKTSFLRASSLITTSANHKLFRKARLCCNLLPGCQCSSANSPALRRASNLLEQDHQLAVLETVTEHGIALLIGMDTWRKLTNECSHWKWYTLGGELPSPARYAGAIANTQKRWKICCGLSLSRTRRCIQDWAGGDSSMKQDASGSLQPEFRAVT